MGNAHVDGARCGQCGRPLDESPNAAVEDRPPCPECGSLSRRLEVSISETIHIYSDLGTKHKRTGIKKPLSEQKHGDSFSARLGRWMRRSRVVDRENNRYTETVVDPKTGDTIHHCDEPLSDHQGHGSAKR